MISLMSKHFLPLGTKHYSSTTDSYEEDFDAPIEVLLLYVDIEFSSFFLLFENLVINIKLKHRLGSHLFFLF